MFSIIRAILVVLFIFLFFMLLKKSIGIRTRLVCVSMCFITMLLIFLLPFIPFENAFYTFDTPIEAFNYYNSTSKEIKLIIEGKTTDFIIGGDADKNINLIIPKTDNGWNVGLGKDTKRIFQKFVDGYSIHIYRYKNNDEYYISVLKVDGGNFEISDNFNSNFYSLSKYNDSLKETFYTYYAYLPNFNSQYIVVLDGVEINLGTG